MDTDVLSPLAQIRFFAPELGYPSSLQEMTLDHDVIPLAHVPFIDLDDERSILTDDSQLLLSSSTGLPLPPLQLGYLSSLQEMTTLDRDIPLAHIPLADLDAFALEQPTLALPTTLADSQLLLAGLPLPLQLGYLSSLREMTIDRDIPLAHIPFIDFDKLVAGVLSFEEDATAARFFF